MQQVDAVNLLHVCATCCTNMQQVDGMCNKSTATSCCRQQQVDSNKLHVWTGLNVYKRLITATPQLFLLNNRKGKGKERGGRGEGFGPPKNFGVQGRLSPNSHGALPPNSHVFPLPFSDTPPRRQYLDILYATLCNFMLDFSEFWKLAVRYNDTEK